MEENFFVTLPMMESWFGKIMKKAAVFLDRDGVINEDHAFVHKIEDFVYIDGVKEALKIIKSKGYLSILVTNQAGIAYGYYTEEDYRILTDWMQNDLKTDSIEFDGIYFCPHHPEKGYPPYLMKCGCRKPETGMLIKAVEDFDIDLSSSFMVGDRMSDVETGVRAGCRGSFLVSTGKPLPHFTGNQPDFVRKNLLEVAMELPVTS